MKFQGVMAAILLFAIGVPAEAQDKPRTLRAPIVENYNLHFDVPPNRLWAELKRLYVKGEKFSEMGFTVAQLADDPLAWLGGTRIRKTLPSGEVDERVARFTMIDDATMFLALTAVYSNGTEGYVSYNVRPAGKGSDFQLIVHALQDVAFAPGETMDKAVMAAKMRDLTAFHNKELSAYWMAEKARLEAKR